jgi:TonB family protein
MMQPRPAERPSGQLKRAMSWSLGAHLLIAAGLLLAGQSAPAQPLQHAIIAELVARGEPKKKKELPRRVRTKKKRAGKRRAKQQAKKTRASANSALKRLEAMGSAEDADDALARLGTQDQTGDDPSKAKGRVDGSDQGTLSQGELLSLQNNYLSKVGQAIKADGNYRISDTISKTERMHLKAVLFLRIGASGQLLEARLESSSGQALFDRDIVAAARSARYPAPPTEIAARLAAGVRGTFRP